MRTFLAVVVLLAIPTFAAAQQKADRLVDVATPTVQLEQSAPAPASTAPAVNADSPDLDIQVEARSMQVDDVADMQEFGSRGWWWIVGAVVVGGLIVVLIT